MRTRAAFTLVEMLVVIAVLALLMGLLFPVFRAVREKGRQARCATQLAQLGKALHLYAHDWNGYIPPYNNSDGRRRPVDGLGLQRAFFPYLRTTACWFCPDDPYSRVGIVAGRGTDFNHRYGSYATTPLVPPNYAGPPATSPWQMDAPGQTGTESPSETAYLEDWFLSELEGDDQPSGPRK